MPSSFGHWAVSLEQLGVKWLLQGRCGENLYFMLFSPSLSPKPHNAAYTEYIMVPKKTPALCIHLQQFPSKGLRGMQKKIDGIFYCIKNVPCSQCSANVDSFILWKTSLIFVFLKSSSSLKHREIQIPEPPLSQLHLLVQQRSTQPSLLSSVSHSYYSSNQFHWHQMWHATWPLGPLFLLLHIQPSVILTVRHLTTTLHILTHLLLPLILSHFLCCLFFSCSIYVSTTLPVKPLSLNFGEVSFFLSPLLSVSPCSLLCLFSSAVAQRRLSRTPWSQRSLS